MKIKNAGFGKQGFIITLDIKCDCGKDNLKFNGVVKKTKMVFKCKSCERLTILEIIERRNK